MDTKVIRDRYEVKINRLETITGEQRTLKLDSMGNSQ
jgi:hypothetical protein